MLKKILTVLCLSVALAVGGAMTQTPAQTAYAAIPSSDTWVMAWNGDMYVKAGTLDITSPRHSDVAPCFNVTVVRVNGSSVSTYNCQFVARGALRTTVNGSITSDYHYEQLYNAIVNRFRSEFY